jgi:hypothetical protein
VNVRSGSRTDIAVLIRDVCFAANTGIGVKVKAGAIPPLYVFFQAIREKLRPGARPSTERGSGAAATQHNTQSSE